MSVPEGERRGFSGGTHLLLPVMFFVSGFCGLLYQTVWLRLAFARFGVITPVVSVVVSVFMLGLGLGSWIGGKYVGTLSDRFRVHAILLYGAIELVIGSGAFAVPILFAGSARLLLHLGETNSWTYLAGSGACLFAAILPFSCAMGATYPAALHFLQALRTDGRQGFGRLYAFNTAGAVAGVLVTVYLLIELLGLRSVLRVGCLGNVSIAVVAADWGRRLGRPARLLDSPPKPEPGLLPVTAGISRSDLTILFVTGFCSMAMEVGWVRSFTPVLDHSVYAFAFLLAAYLAGHAAGATAHALTAARGVSPVRTILVGATLVTASIPIALADWEWALGEEWKVARGEEHVAIALSIGAFAAALGWLTPMLVDTISRGRPGHAGVAYAVNIAGCMLGPLVMGYAVLPFLGPRVGLALLCLPLAGLLALDRKELLWKSIALVGAAGILIAALLGRSFEEGWPLAPGEKGALYRDYTATTIARDRSGVKSLLVNGFPMTTQSPITQMMAHLPFALHGSPPQKVLVICLGMGTTFRSAQSWGADVTVVELVPGVASAFRALEAEKPPLGATAGRIIIDDGRRFLARTTEKFDVIIIDPPPPVEQPASSLLYSVEFYGLLKEHLKPDGIVQQWWGFPYSAPFVTEAMARSVQESFPYVRKFSAVRDPLQRMQGFHFICSLAPVAHMTAEQFLARLPEGARRDMRDWTVTETPESEIEARLAEQIGNEFRWTNPLGSNRITDDHPLNEYLYVREHDWTARLLLGRR